MTNKKKLGSLGTSLFDLGNQVKNWQTLIELSIIGEKYSINEVHEGSSEC